VAVVCTSLAAAAVAAGGLALVGWWSGTPRLTSLLPDAERMRPNTALCLVVLGLALLRRWRRARRAALAGTASVLALATATLVEIATGTDLRLDELVPFADTGTLPPRMALATAVVLLLLATGTLLAETGRSGLSQVVAVPAFATAYLAVVGYVFGATNLYTVPGHVSIAAPTALSLTALSLVLLLRPRSSVLDVLVEDPGTAGRLVRGLLPFLLLGPPALGWLALAGQRRDWFGERFGTGMLVAAFTATTTVLLLRAAIRIREADVDRAVLLHRVVEVNRDLEATVTARTAELTEARSRLAAAFASSPLGTALTTVHGVIEEVNRLLPELASTPAEELVGRDVECLFSDHLGAEEHWLRRELLEEGRGSYQLERRLARAGAACWVLVSVAAVADEHGTRGLLYQLEDVTARRLAEERAEHMALHDTLTDLPNRALLLDRLRQALAQANRTGRGVGVLFIDLDRFKVVNDSMGHHVGDALLKEVAHRLRRAARAADTVARIGGDEFVVVVPDVGSERDVLQVADQLRRAVAHAFVVEGGQTLVDASIGVAFGVGHDDPDLLLRQADQAMYRAKDLGRARFEVFDDDLRTRINRRLDTELALRGAVERGEIETWYQPLVELSDVTAVAVEALVRWRRPERGVVVPDEFVRVAEEIGLIEEIGTTVLHQACAAAASLPGRTAVSVNVSPQQFVRSDFRAVVEEALVVSGLAPDRLWIELTESAVVEAIDSAARAFQALREQGVRVAIDDFGTGFSSFSHLRDFRVDLIKVDRSFIHDLRSSSHDRAIVQGIVRMADALRLDVVAEGIETTDQRDLLRVYGCRYGQGFLFARPSPIAVPQVAPVIPGPRAVEQEAPH